MQKLNSDEIIIREMIKDDIERLIQIEKEQNISISSITALTDSFNESTSFYYVAIYNRQIIGYFGIDIIDDFVDILSIVVKKDFQNIGIGKLLLNEILKIAKKNNIQKIFLEVRKSNIIAQNLYGSFNFKLINTRKNYYPDNL